MLWRSLLKEKKVIMVKNKVFCYTEVDVDSFFDVIREEWSDKDKIEFIMDLIYSLDEDKSINILMKKIKKEHFSEAPIKVQSTRFAKH